LAPRVYGVGNTGARIVLRATQEAWVQVRDSDDNLLLTRLLRAGDSYRVPNRPGLTMLTGNAGGLEITVDGNRLGSLGSVGKVRRDVPLDPARQPAALEPAALGGLFAGLKLSRPERILCPAEAPRELGSLTSRPLTEADYPRSDP
jgi:hypothetical protein